MNFSNVKNFTTFLLLLTLCFQQTTFAQNTGGTIVQRTLYATIISPSRGELLSVTDMDPIDAKDPFYQTTTLIKGVAQRKTTVDMYVFTKIPELIKGFTASVTAPVSSLPFSIPLAQAANRTMTFRWQPRDVYTCRGEGCKNGSSYYAYVNPGKTINIEALAKDAIPTLPENRPGMTFCPDINTIDCLKQTPPSCCTSQNYEEEISSTGGICTYDYAYQKKWFNDTGKEISDPTHMIETEKRVHTYKVQIKEIITAKWEDPKTGDACPLTYHDSNTFSFIPTAYATPGGGGGGSKPNPPGPGGNRAVLCVTTHCTLVGTSTMVEKKIKVLVDDFSEYTLVYGEVPQENQIGQQPSSHPFSFIPQVQAQSQTDNPQNYVWEDRGVSYYMNKKISVGTNPLTNHVTITGLDQTKTYRFALYENRRRTDYPNSPYPADADNITTPLDVSGYLYGAQTPNGGNEVEISSSEVSYPAGTKDKVELEVVAENLPVDNDEHFSMYISKMALNPSTKTHFIAAVYNASDVISGTGSKTLSIQTTSKLASFDIRDKLKGGAGVLNPNITYANTEPSPYGIVYDAWTMEPLKSALVQVAGNSGSVETGNISYVYYQKTNQDGLYSFYLPKGTYTLSVGNLTEGVQSNFVFPPTPCPSNPMYTNYCGTPLKITEGKQTHVDIPVSPLLYGKALSSTTLVIRNTETNVLYTTTVFPDGKYSFFIPPGKYTYEKLIKADKTEQALSHTVQISSTQQVNF